MSEILESQDGTVLIEDLGNDRRKLTSEPNPPNTFIRLREYETAYPNSLIRAIFDQSSAAWCSSNIAREEDPSEIERLLTGDIFAYFDPSELDGTRILDFGCGYGASTAILSRLFPNSDITGVELNAPLLGIAGQIADHYGLNNVRFLISPGGDKLPSGLGEFDFVIMSAVYEHLLPNERQPIMTELWKAVRPGGFLFLNQTPNSSFPIELHTTMLPLINYVPDAVALWTARKFSNRIAPDATWEYLLREGIRGATVTEIIKKIETAGPKPKLLEPNKNSINDRIDLYYANTNKDNHRLLKNIAWFAVKGVKAVTRIEMVPDLSLAFQKPKK